MHWEVHHYHHFAGEQDTARALARIEQKLAQILNQGAETMADLSALEAEVAENTDVVASASTLLDNLAQELRNAADDPAAVQALADQLDANNAGLAASVARNTSAEGGGGGEVPPSA